MFNPPRMGQIAKLSNPSCIFNNLYISLNVCSEMSQCRGSQGGPPCEGGSQAGKSGDDPMWKWRIAGQQGGVHVEWKSQWLTDCTLYSSKGRLTTILLIVLLDCLRIKFLCG